MQRIGIIGGSGLENPDILQDARDELRTTQWGAPSAPLRMGRIGNADVVLFGRHGREHTIPPSQVNYRANIQALKDAGCSHILATTAVGSLREDIGRGDLVIIDQFIDFTKQRAMSFHTAFNPHHPIHTPMADPFNANLRELLAQSCQALGLRHHRGGTVVTIEGPRFSTRAESRMFQAWGGDIINMSIATEAALANEAEIPYAAVAMSTDYDCWKTDEAPVNWDAILSVFQENARKVTDVLVHTVSSLARAQR